MEHAITGIRSLLLEAVEDLTGVIATRPSELAAYFNRAVVFEKLGRVDDAMTDINMVLNLMPDTRAHLLRMRIRRSQTLDHVDTAKLALEDFRAALELDEELATSQIYF